MLQAKLEAKFHEQTGENHFDISLPSHHSFWIPPSALFAKHPHSPLLVSNFWAVKFYINNKTTKFPTPPRWDFFLFQLVKILPRNSKSWVISSFYRSCRVIGYMRYLQLFYWQGWGGFSWYWILATLYRHIVQNVQYTLGRHSIPSSRCGD